MTTAIPFARARPARADDGGAGGAHLPAAAPARVVADRCRRRAGPPASCPARMPTGCSSPTLPDRAAPFAYRLRLEVGAGNTVEIDDPYRFPPVLGELDAYLIAEGNHLRLYEKLGAHPMELEGVAGVAFLVWAPNAPRVTVVGDFNGWDGRRHPMRKRVECGVWELFMPGLDRGRALQVRDQGRPTASCCRSRPTRSRSPPSSRRAPPRSCTGSASRRWSDQRVDGRARGGAAPATRRSRSTSAISAPGCACPSRATATSPTTSSPSGWCRTSPRWASPISSCCRSRSIRSTARGATSRSGCSRRPAATATRRRSRASSTAATRSGIGVLLDWVPGHFPTDPHGLGYFDGTHLYEHADPRLGFHLDWNTLIYNYGRREVANFLLANALVLAAPLSHRRAPGRCRRLDALPRLLAPARRVDPQHVRRQREPGCDRVPAPAQRAGLRRGPGRDRPSPRNRPPGRACRARPISAASASATNGTWAGCTTRSATSAQDPVHRKYHHHELTFGLIYAFTENFILPLSHDEVVHGKGSLLGKMPGDRWQKFANLRAYFGFMFGHPGKKLLFMGGEFGQEREWNHDASLDWHLLGRPDASRRADAGARPEPALSGAARAAPARLRGRGLRVDRAARQRAERAGVHAPRPPIRRAMSWSPATSRRCRATATGSACRCPGYYRERLNTDAAVYGGGNIGNGGGVDGRGRRLARPAALAVPHPAPAWER